VAFNVNLKIEMKNEVSLKKNDRITVNNKISKILSS
jgi:hypothetical protein